MKITLCPKLEYLFSTSLAQTLVHLEVLQIWHCNSLKHVIVEEGINEDEIVSNMDGDSLSWPKLKTVRIRNCKSLKHLFPMTSVQGLPHLELVDISDCAQLKHVFKSSR